MTFRALFPNPSPGRLLLLPAAVLALAGSARAFPSDTTRVRVLGIVDTIIVSGNEKTQTYVILDEMTLRPGSQVTNEAMEYDRERIYSLGLFTNVDMMYDSVGSVRFLFVEVRERWYIIPIPIFGFRDGDPHKIFFGAGLLHYNFRGRNQTLYGSLIFGYDPSIAFSFTDPQIDREDNLYAGLSTSYSRVKNRSVVQEELTGDFYERHFDVNGTLGKRYSLYSSAGINVGFHEANVTSYLPGRTVSPGGTDRYLYATASYLYDSRNLKEYATSGSMLSLYVSRSGFGESAVGYTRFGADAREYLPFAPSFSLATRLFGSVVSGGLVPTYAHTYFGTGERIRGYYHVVMEGEDIAGGTAEIRFSLLDPRTFFFSAVQIPSEFSVWRFGVTLVLFTDTGTTWYRGDRLQFTSLATGYGTGIHFLLPYSVILRTEYAWNLDGVGQFIIDIRGNI
ncbi:MAG TPA: POTRA domain-containing protein [Bacteroidota bacterium]|nr:POTRA domain-containing protein [Bacteroidota bacterium]